MDKLKHCPFCGNEDIEIMKCHNIVTNYDFRPHYYNIGCKECGAWIEGNHSRAEAVSGWNARI